jgi:hypothetical protein
MIHDPHHRGRPIRSARDRRRAITGAFLAAAVLSVFGFTGVSAAGAAGAAARAPQPARPAARPLAVSGARLWGTRYNGPGNGDSQATTVAARAGRVLVTGGSPGTTSGLDYATIAYRG